MKKYIGLIILTLSIIIAGVLIKSRPVAVAKENKEDILRDGTKRHFAEFKINPLYTNQERFYHSEPKEPTSFGSETRVTSIILKP